MNNNIKSDQLILTLQYHHDIWFFAHIVFWSIILFFLLGGTIYSACHPISFIIGVIISGLLIYKKLYYYLKTVNINFYRHFLIVNKKKYFYKDVSFKLQKDIRGTQIHGIFFKKNELIINFVIQSFLCPSLVWYDPESIHLIFSSIKSGKLQNISTIEKKCYRESNYNKITSFMIILFFLLLLSPIIIMAKLRGIPIF